MSNTVSQSHKLTGVQYGLDWHREACAPDLYPGDVCWWGQFVTRVRWAGRHQTRGVRSEPDMATDTAPDNNNKQPTSKEKTNMNKYHINLFIIKKQTNWDTRYTLGSHFVQPNNEAVDALFCKMNISEWVIWGSIAVWLPSNAVVKSPMHSHLSSPF